MKLDFRVDFRGEEYMVNLDDPHPIGIPLSSGAENPNCFYAEQPLIKPFRSGTFIGSIKAGSPVNFFDISFNPHGNGTHTECSGHVFDNGLVMSGLLKKQFFLAQLLSVNTAGIDFIGAEVLEVVTPGVEALVIRTLPNSTEKMSKQYSGTNPVYCDPELLKRVCRKGIDHFLIDLPSVDPEKDDGKLAAHKAFWNNGNSDRTTCTISELIYVSEALADGVYLLEMNYLNIELDAAPSNPILYPLKKV